MYKSNDNPNPAKAPNTRVVIIGAIAGGAAAAARLTRLNNTLNITLLEKGPNVSVATCGMPYYIGGEIAKESDLLVHTPSSLKNAIGVTNVFVNTEVVRIDRSAKVVHAVTRLQHTEEKKKEEGGASAVVISAEAEAEYPYDFLIIATGGIPATPPVFGGPNPTATSDPFVKDRVVILRNIEDMRKIVDLLGGRHKVGKAAAGEAAASSKKLITATANESEKKEKTTKNTEPLSVTVVGAGFIGIEIAEQICLLGHKVTIVERNPTVLPVLDDEFGAMLHPVIREKGIDLITNDSVCKITAHPENNNNNTNNNNKFKKLLALETAGGKKISAHFVVLSAGIRPETSLAKACGLATSAPASLISVDNYMRTSDPSIYAVGDAVEISDGVFRDVKTWTALATVAAVQARIAADHIALGSTVPFRGSFNTAITRCFGYAVGTTGWTEKRLKNKKEPSSSSSNSNSNNNGIPYAVSVVNGFGSASYYNEGGKRPPMPATVKLTYCPTTGRIFGGQVFGHCNAGVDKRLDVIATALLGNLTVQEVSHAQFAYAPPFNASKDVVSVAAMNARNISFESSRGANKNGFLAHASTRLDPTATILDVRPDAAFKNDPITTAFEGQRKKSLFWVTSREGAKKLVAEEKKEAEAGNNTNKNDKNNNIVPGRYQSICFWGRTSYFTHRNLLQTAGIKPATVTTLQGGNLYAKALKEAERCGSKL